MKFKYIFIAIIASLIPCISVDALNACVYKTSDGKPIYLYKKNMEINTSLGGSFDLGYAVVGCIGNYCINNNPNTSSTANYLDYNNSGFANYHANIDNCNNMPQNIWYEFIDNKVNFYPSNENKPNAISATLDTADNSGNNVIPGIDWDDPESVTCEGIIGTELLELINKIFRWIQIIAPIFVIIMGSVEFAGAVLQDDKDALKKASGRFIKRLIIAVALFFIPLIMSYLLGIFNEVTGASSSICNIGE